MNACTSKDMSYEELNGDGWRYSNSMDLNYAVSDYDDLGKEMPMFSNNGINPCLAIIGKNSRLVFLHEDYITEEEIRTEIENAIADLNGLNQVERLKNIYITELAYETDLDNKFLSLSGGEISYEIVSNSSSGIAAAEISGNTLILEKGFNTGITEITLKAVSGDEEVSDSFQAAAYPDNAQVAGFEENEAWNSIIYIGDKPVWYEQTETVFDGSYSLQSADLGYPAYGDTVSTVVQTRFSSSKMDTVFFAYKISSRYDRDGMAFYIDEEFTELPDKRWSGETGWRFARYSVGAGDHSLKWTYFKTEYGSAGKDAAWLDLIRVPGVITGISQKSPVKENILLSNYPNPFNGLTTINFRLPEDSEVRLKIYNSSGQAVLYKDLGKMPKGPNSHAVDIGGFKSGLYFYTVKTNEKEYSKKMLYLK
ncbi:MAG: T9SS type A sorting domain-containing protein [Candidatus Delongbacteria bacterium]